MSLLHQLGKQLPPIAHAYPTGNTQPAPETFQAVSNLPSEGSARNRPEGGMWSAPVNIGQPDGTPAGTEWTGHCHLDPYGYTLHPSGRHYDRSVDVLPDSSARIYLINTQDDLHRLLEAFPPIPKDHYLQPVTPNWEALAGSGIDAVFLTWDGLAANSSNDRHPLMSATLHGWDSASVLWLRPAYRCEFSVCGAGC
ncbi:hypothetical protein ACWC9T_41390 [Kitasatospora sp. NPDC001159]